MSKNKIIKLLLTASAETGFALVLAQAPSNAASASYCAAHARTIASHEAAMGSAAFRRTFDRAYANCRGSGAGIMNPTFEQQALTAAPAPALPAPQESGSCNFGRYHTSWDPTQCP